MTDKNIADATYLEPITLNAIEEIIKKKNLMQFYQQLEVKLL